MFTTDIDATSELLRSIAIWEQTTSGQHKNKKTKRSNLLKISSKSFWSAPPCRSFATLPDAPPMPKSDETTELSASKSENTPATPKEAQTGTPRYFSGCPPLTGSGYLDGTRRTRWYD